MARLAAFSSKKGNQMDKTVPPGAAFRTRN
jgi:hypothetical protein